MIQADAAVPAVSGAPSSGRVEPLGADALREMHFFLRLAREWDLRFERLVRVGSVSKWYSSVGNEGITVAAATAIEAGDALVTLHRDSGAILRYYLDPAQLFPDWFVPPSRRTLQADSRELLYRLACQMLGRTDGFSGGRERSYHYSHLARDAGILHVGMISHLGAMIPVAAGLALALQREGSDRVAINFIGEGGTSTGDFHEGLNMAAVLKVPFVLVIENNGYAFSTPASEQYASASLAERGAAYGIPGVRVDGCDALAVYAEVAQAVARARRGAGPTLIEAIVGRMRGHSEGDDSLQLLTPEERKRNEASDPLLRFEELLLTRGVATRARMGEVGEACRNLVLEVVDRALASPQPDAAGPPRSVYAD
ncbi:MAG TPA: thiamine pyrophosphate-dependent dehydrogenase E1 component subunit alpha [Planctomycetota bacterium]|nr:thiamine pyrophosphate-dependent dehydrogenase E1 component subunit alpha [Planctomycetota bacterium]